jgi:hypothetical protein
VPCTAGEREAAAKMLAAEATSTTLPTPSAQEAIMLAQNARIAAFTRIDRVKARLVRVGDVRSRAEPGAWSRDDEDLGWAVAISGDITSFAGDSLAQVAPTHHFTWWVTVIDVKTHIPVLFDGGQGPWPPYFDSIPSGG